MKKIIYSFIVIAIVGFAFQSCEKQFLETYPTDAVSANAVTLTTDNAMAALNGIHRMPYVRYEGTQGNGGVGAHYICIDCQADDHVVNAQQWYYQVYQWLPGPRDATHYYNRFPFRMYYRFIANANVLINGIDDAEGPQATKDVIKGQALLYRAWSHYQVVQMYAERYKAGGNNTQLGIPYMMENLTEGQARNTVEEVYTNINADLVAAKALLQGYSRPNKSHINADVVTGIMARVALTQHKFAEAAQLAASIKGNYTLMDQATYADGFRINSQNISEFMWASQIIEDQTDKWANYGAYMSRNFSSSAIRGNPRSINSLLYDKISDTDVRKTLWDPTGKHLNLPEGISLLGSHKRFPYTSQKFIAVSSADSRVDVPHLRASELYLIEAEAKARLNQDEAAAQVLYEFAVTRDSEYTKSTKTGAALIEEIMVQRRVELWGEGFRWYDLKRLNLPLDRTNSNHVPALAGNLMQVPAGDEMWQWLIPQDEMDANPLMVQNPL